MATQPACALCGTTDAKRNRVGRSPSWCCADKYECGKRKGRKSAASELARTRAQLDEARERLASAEKERGGIIADLSIKGRVALVHGGRVRVDFLGGSIAGAAWLGAVQGNEVRVEVRDIAALAAARKETP